MSLNDDADCITALPGLDDSITDKLMIIKCSTANMLPDYAENMARFKMELPAFVHFLLQDFTIPEQMRHTRFGVQHYHNPEIAELLRDFEPHLKFKELLDATFFQDSKFSLTKLLASEIQRRLEDGKYGNGVRQLIGYSTACGVHLSRLAREEPSRFERSRSKGVTRWTIHAPEELF